MSPKAEPGNEEHIQILTALKAHLEVDLTSFELGVLLK